MVKVHSKSASSLKDKTKKALVTTLSKGTSLQKIPPVKANKVSSQIGQLSLYDQLELLRKENKELSKQITELKKCTPIYSVATQRSHLIAKPRGEVGRGNKFGHPNKKNSEGYCLKDELGLKYKKSLYLRIRVCLSCLLGLTLLTLQVGICSQIFIFFFLYRIHSPGCRCYYNWWCNSCSEYIFQISLVC